jgi:hypothetical protein
MAKKRSGHRGGEFSGDPSQGPPDARAEKRRLQERVRSLIRTICGKPNLEVTTQVDPMMRLRMTMEGTDPDRQWYQQVQYDPQTRDVIRELVHIPEEILEEPEEVVKGKAAHEAAHVISTRFGEFIPDDVLQQVGFHGLMAAAEERPTDQVVRDRYPGAGRWVDTARLRDIAEMSFRLEGTDRLGWAPAFGQLCDLIVHEAVVDEIPDFYNPEVVALYERIRPIVERIEHTIPSEAAGEDEVVALAQERYRDVYTQLWPVVRELVAEDLEQEAIRQMISDAKQESDGERDGPDLSSLLDQLSSDLREELEQAMQRGQQGQESADGDSENGDESAVSEGDAEERPVSDGALERDVHATMPSKGAQSSEAGDSGGAKEEDTTALSEAGNQDSPPGDTESVQPSTVGSQAENGTPIPMDQLSEALQHRLRELFDSLSEAKKRTLAEMAIKALQQLEDVMVQQQSSKLDSSPVRTHEQHQEQESREEREDRFRKLESTFEGIDEERQEATSANNADAYERAYQEIREFDDELYEKLDEIFHPNIKRKTHLTAAGSRINLPAVVRREAARAAGSASIDPKIFEHTHTPEKKNYAITLLVDLSGSMQEQGRIQETFKAVVLLSEVLSRIGIAFELLGFQDEVITFMGFQEELQDVVRQRMSGMIGEVYDQNPGGHNNANYNDDGPCLLDASKGLEEQQAKHRFLIVLSDGLPAGRRSNENDLTRAVEHILSTTDQMLIGVGLGRGTEHVQDYYPAALPNIDVRELPAVLGELLEDILRNPQKYVVQD